MKKIIILSSIGLLLLFGIITISMSISLNNKHVELEKLYEAENANVEATLDKMWNVISDKFQISSEYASEFKEVAKINVGAFEPSGEAWKWINTHLPQIDAAIFSDVMATVASERDAFKRAQQKTIDVVRAHNTLIATWPGKWFITDKTEIIYEVISNAETKTIIETRIDNRSIKNERSAN